MAEATQIPGEDEDWLQVSNGNTSLKKDFEKNGSCFQI